MKYSILLALFVALAFPAHSYADTIRLQIPDGGFESGINSNGFTHWSGAGSQGGGGDNYASNLQMGITPTLSIPGTSIVVLPTEGNLFGFSLASTSTSAISSSFTQVDTFSFWEHDFMAQPGDRIVGDYFSYLSATGQGASSAFFISLFRYDPITQNRGALVFNFVSSSLTGAGTQSSATTPWTEISSLIPTVDTYELYAQGTSEGIGASTKSSTNFGLDNFYLERTAAAGVSEPSSFILLGFSLAGVIAVRVRKHQRRVRE